MRLLFATIIIGLYAILTFAQLPPRIEGTRIQDHAQLLTTEQRAHLQAKTDKLKVSKDIELGVILVNDFGGLDSVEFATKAMRDYGIGSAEGEHRGIAFIWGINQSGKNCFVAPSRHLEGVFTDGQLGQLCRDARPYKKSGGYFGAIDFITDRLVQMADGISAQQIQGIKTDQSQAPQPVSSGWTIVTILIIIVIVVIAFVIIIALIGASSSGGHSGSSWSSGGGSGGVSGGGGDSGGGSSGGFSGSSDYGGGGGGDSL